MKTGSNFNKGRRSHVPKKRPKTRNYTKRKKKYKIHKTVLKQQNNLPKMAFAIPTKKLKKRIKITKRTYENPYMYDFGKKLNL